jgi:probable HAF family extracellular repeat protein
MVAGTQGKYPNVKATVWKKGKPKGVGSGYAYAINNKGMIAGAADSRAVVWFSGKVIKIGALPLMQNVPVKVYDSLACGINNLGEVVGITDFVPSKPTVGGSAQAFFPHVFLYTPGAAKRQMIDLGDAGVSGTAAINATGQIACELGDSAALWTAGLRTPIIPPPGYYHLSAEGISDDAAIVGTMTASATSGGGSRAFLWSHGYALDIGTLGGRNSVAFGVNTSHEVVGTASTRPSALPGKDGPRHAFIWLHGRMNDLNTLTTGSSGWVLESANAINNLGQIAGYGTLNGVGHAFLLSRVQPNH